MLRLTEEQVRSLINSKPSTSILINLSSMEEIKIELSEKTTDSTGFKYRTLTIENTSLMITEDQAEQLFNTLEPKLYDETFAKVEDEYRTERTRRKQLEGEVEHLRARLSEVKVCV